MSSEILSVLEYMEKEKGISRDDMISTITMAIKHAASKGPNAGQELKLEINPKNGALSAWQIFRVVDSVGDPHTEMHVEKANLIKPGAMIGEMVEKEIDPALLGRIVAQVVLQAIRQRVRQFEKDRIYDEYKDTVNDVVSGTVRRRERGDLVIDLGKAEAVLPAREQVPGEDYAPGERIRCLLLAIESSNRGPELILSRSSPRFVRRLFELEVTEISDGTVKIEAFAREPGYRTKIAVSSTDKKVDPVGACVGARGARVKSIVRELGGEKIDIMEYKSDPRELLLESLKPVKPLNTRLDERNRRIEVEVAEADLALVIGRRGQNARLTSRLLGLKLDIVKQQVEVADFDSKKAGAAASLSAIPGIDEAMAARLVPLGFISAEAFAGVEEGDLIEAGFEPAEARDILAKVGAHLDGNRINQ
ncbi:MAG: transcription termination factor NusA [Opitutaceae bacterium]